MRRRFEGVFCPDLSFSIIFPLSTGLVFWLDFEAPINIVALIAAIVAPLLVCKWINPKYIAEVDEKDIWLYDLKKKKRIARDQVKLAEYAPLSVTVELNNGEIVTISSARWASGSDMKEFVNLVSRKNA